MSLRQRIQVLLAFLVAIPLVILLFETSRSSHRVILRQMKEESLQLASLQAAEMDLTFVPARQIAQSVARAMESQEALAPGAIQNLVRSTLDHAPEVYGIGVALDPTASPLGRFAPYAFHRDGQIHERALHDPNYVYTNWDWYRTPMAMGRGLWTQPYFDRGGGDTPMITYSQPFRRAGRIVGVATVDLSLGGLIDRLDRLHPGGSGTVYLVDRTGHVLVHPNLPPLDPAGRGVDPKAEGQLRKLLRNPGTDTLEMIDPVSRRLAWVVEMPVRSMTGEEGGQDWSVIVSWPLGKRLAPVLKLAERVLLLFLFLGGGALLFLNRAFDQIVTRPIRRLVDQARRYAKGDFTVHAGAGEEALELRELSQALGTLGAALQERTGAEGRHS